MTRRVLALCIALGAACLPAVARAQSGTWTSLGPTNLGGPVSGIVIDPASPATLVVSGSGGGIWRSVNDGMSWTPVGDALASLAIYQLVAHPTQANVIFAPSGGGLLKSTDFGQTWARVGTFSPLRLAISADGQVMLALGPAGTSRSTDQGVTWTLVLPATITPLNASDVAFSAADPQRAITFGVLQFDGSSRYSYSTNAGLTWANSASPGVISCCADNSRDAFAPGTPFIAYILNRTATQVLRSNDGGVTFTPRSTTNLPAASDDSPRRLSLWVDPANPDSIVVGERDLWRSADGGNTFTRISDWASAPLLPGGQPNVIVSAPGFDGASNRRVYVGTDAGLFRTDDIYAVTPASGWTSLNSGLVLGSFVSAAAVYSGPVLGLTPDHGVWRMAGGASAATRTGGSASFPGYFSGSLIGQIGTDSVGAGPFFFVDSVGGALFRSTDAGASFAPVAIPATASLHLVRPPVSGTVGLATQIGLFRSQDAANPVPTWQQLLTGVIVDAAYPAGHADVEMAVTGPADGRLLQSPNAGVPSPTFVPITPPGLQSRIKTVLPGSADGEVTYLTALVGTDWQIWRRLTAAGGFSNVSIPGAVVNALAVHPRNPLRVYAATSTGVYESLDGGSHWAFNFPNHANVTDLTWQDKRLIAATSGRGMWALDVPGDPILFIDAPPPGSTLAEPFALRGWAIDRADASGSGIDSVVVYAVPASGGPAIYLGAATVGVSRPDIGAAYGAQFANAGFSMPITGLASGGYQLVVYAHSSFSNQFTGAPTSVTLAPSVMVIADQPALGATLGLPVVVSGWAADGAAASGTGIDGVEIWAVPASGAPARYLGAASVGLSRPDVGSALGTQFTNSGYALTATGLGPGKYQIVIYAHSVVSQSYTATTVPISVVGAGVRAVIDAPAPNATVTSGSMLHGWAVDLATPSGTGVSAVHVWAVPVTPGPALFVGAASYGQSRPDVGAVFGASFTPSGYSLPISGLAPGTYDLVVYIFSDVSQSFASALVVRVTVQ